MGADGKGPPFKGQGKGDGGPKRVFFKNALFETTHGYLMGLFKKHGYVLELNLWTHPDGRSRGMGTVEYGKTAEARSAANALDGIEVDGRPLRVEMEDLGRSSGKGPGGDEARGKGAEGAGKGAGKGAGGKGPPGTRTLLFRNVLYETTPGFLMGIFKRHGRVLELDLHRAPDGRSRGEGTVEYGHAAEAQDALAELDGVEVDGRPMHLELLDAGRAPGPRRDMGKGWKGDGKGGKGEGKGHSGSRKVFFKNVLFETPEGFLESLFRQYGTVREFIMFKSPDGRSKGLGTVEFARASEAATAIEELDGAEVDGRVIGVAPDRSDDGPRGPPAPAAGAVTCRVFFKNVLFETPGPFLHGLFKRHGFVVDFHLWKGPEGRSRGMGTVDYRHPSEARAAVVALGGAEVDGRIMTVELEDPQRAAEREAREAGGRSAGKGGGKAGAGGHKVFFKNALFETTPGFLLGKFKRFGYVLNLDVWKHPDGRSKGQGTVEYGSQAEAEAAVDGLNGVEVDGRPMVVELHDPTRSAGAAVAVYTPVKSQGKGKGRHTPY